MLRSGVFPFGTEIYFIYLFSAVITYLEPDAIDAILRILSGVFKSIPIVVIVNQRITADLALRTWCLTDCRSFLSLNCSSFSEMYCNYKITNKLRLDLKALKCDRLKIMSLNCLE